ncbi:AraC family transcriptional regulator [uncultured Ligilactobacillus sp.]|uniref:AraC family transcriptional regulator n=1 Tax=uncultured Ligilactobacillus sp. TaxID=2837633 RepID=UPI00272BDD5B|nr:AraC family transcriptional regulator [uncultured Ligilactobacillus sp.]
MEKAVTMNFIPPKNDQLRLLSVGRSDTLSSHKYGPAVRNYYLIHYILAGLGTFQTEQLTYRLHAGQGFLIEPGQETTYIADKNTPWSYIWIGFAGSFADQLMQQLPINQHDPIFSLPNAKRLLTLSNLLLTQKETSNTQKLLDLSYLLEYLSIISTAKTVISKIPTHTLDPYVEQAIYLISQSFPQVSANFLADQIGLDRSYLGKRFKRATGMTIQAYLKNYRITQARHLIESTDLSLLQIAQACGYERPDSLTRAFKQTYGLTPSNFKQQQRELMSS